MKKITSICLLLISCFCFKATAGVWKMDQAAEEQLSIFTFDEDFSRSGEAIYENSCKSCHGLPTEENYAKMFPLPGDLGSSDIQDQTDGSLFFKIQKGNKNMPGFGNALSEEEIWSLVSYIRSFNEDYEQAKPDLSGIDIPELLLQLSFDDNVDKLVVKVTDTAAVAIKDASVSAFIKGMFGNLALGKENSNKYGIAYFDVDSKMPGDEAGNLDIIVKATKGYGSKKVEQQIALAQPTVKKSAIEGRHLWSKAKHAPIWLIVIFNLMFVGVWGTILFIALGLRKIKKLS